MHTVRAFLLIVVVFSNVSLLAQIDRESVKLDYNVIDSLVALNKNNPAEVLQYEKKLSGKKKIRVRDGATGVN